MCMGTVMHLSPCPSNTKYTVELIELFLVSVCIDNVTGSLYSCVNVTWINWESRGIWCGLESGHSENQLFLNHSGYIRCTDNRHELSQLSSVAANVKRRLSMLFSVRRPSATWRHPVTTTRTRTARRRGVTLHRSRSIRHCLGTQLA